MRLKIPSQGTQQTEQEDCRCKHPEHRHGAGADKESSAKIQHSRTGGARRKDIPERRTENALCVPILSHRQLFRHQLGDGGRNAV